MAACHAGRALAIIPVISSRVAALQYVTKSLLLIPYSRLVRRRDNNSAATTLKPRPHISGIIALYKITAATFEGVAPSATRIPISRARRADVYAITPYTPKAVRSSERPLSTEKIQAENRGRQIEFAINSFMVSTFTTGWFGSTAHTCFCRAEASAVGSPSVRTTIVDMNVAKMYC